MKSYRDVYQEVLESTESASLRKYGIEVNSNDSKSASLIAVLCFLAARVSELENKLSEYGEQRKE